MVCRPSAPGTPARIASTSCSRFALRWVLRSGRGPSRDRTTPHRILRLESGLRLLERRGDLLPRDHSRAPRARAPRHLLRAGRLRPAEAHRPASSRLGSRGRLPRRRGRGCPALRARGGDCGPGGEGERGRRVRRASRGEGARALAAGHPGRVLGRGRACDAGADGGEPGRPLPRPGTAVRSDPHVRRRRPGGARVPALRRPRVRPHLQRARSVDAPSSRAGSTLRLRPRLPGEPPSRSRGASRGILPSRRSARARCPLSHRRQRLARQADACERERHRSRLHPGSQRAELHREGSPQHQSRFDGAVRILARHARVRGRRSGRLHRYRRLRGSRAVPRAGEGDPDRAGWRRGGADRALVLRRSGSRHRRCGEATGPGRAHLCPSRRALRRRGAADGAPQGGLVKSPMDIVILGLSITSSWGNGHATTYRGLMRELCRRGHDVLFLEHDKPWYAQNRDLPSPGYGRTELYQDVEELKSRFAEEIGNADLVIVGSYVPDGIAVARWVQAVASGIIAFYDIDTPVTLAALADGTCSYLDTALVPGFDLYLSFTGGPALRQLEISYGARAARALYCGVDPERHRS